MVAAMMTSQQALSGSKVLAAPRSQPSARRGIVAVRAGKYDEELMATAKHMTAPGKGLLAIDESNATAGKRLDSIGGEQCWPPCVFCQGLPSPSAWWLGFSPHALYGLRRADGSSRLAVENTQENRRAYRTLLLTAPGA